LTTLFGNTAIPAVPAVSVVEAPAKSRKRTWLPLLTVLFLISYALMIMLIIEQGQTIESQRALIRELYRDSSELANLRKTQQDQNLSAAAHSQVAPSDQQAPVTQKSQTPSTQAPSKHIPSSQAAPSHRAQNQSEKKPDFQMPSKAASDLVDDVRTLNVI
jgi:hypothetical protein